MRMTSWLAFLLSFLLTLAACQYALPERDIPSYVRGTIRLSGSALQ